MGTGDKNNLAAALASFVRSHVFLILGFAIVLAVLSCWTMSTPLHRWGDASTYYMQIISIADDHDLEYRPLDIARALEHKFDDLPNGLILIKAADDRYFYGKDFTYALFAAPFYLAFGNGGILLFNGLMFLGLILMGYLLLRRHNGRLMSFSASLLYFFLSAALVYVLWVHAEIFNMFLIMLALFVWTAYLKRPDAKYLVLASLLIGLAVVAKAPNMVFFLPLIGYELYKKRPRNFVIMLAALAVPVVICYGYFYLTTGVISFYGGDRYTYLGQYPFTTGFDAAQATVISDFSLDSNPDVLINTSNLVIVPYNIFYYLFGRFTGMLWYYPFAVFALLSGVWLLLERFRGRPVAGPGNADFEARGCVLAGAVLYILVFTTVIGNNYLGGQHAVGDRYFYVYPALIFLLRKIDVRMLLVFVALALVFLGPIVTSPVQDSTYPELHAYNYLYAYLPLEYSQLQNLPVWLNSYHVSGYHIYSMDSRFALLPKNDTVYCLDSDFYLKSDQKAPAINLTISSLTDGNNVDFTYGGREYHFTVDSGQPYRLEIAEPAPDYADGRYYVYRATARSDGVLLVNIG